jgi:hypothetical protein
MYRISWPGVFFLALAAASTGFTLGWLYGLIRLVQGF